MASKISNSNHVQNFFFVFFCYFHMRCLFSDHLTTLLRDLVLCRMGRYGDESVLKEARERFKLHLSGEKLLPADLKTPVSFRLSFIYMCHIYASHCWCI